MNWVDIILVVIPILEDCYGQRGEELILTVNMRFRSDLKVVSLCPMLRSLRTVGELESILAYIAAVSFTTVSHSGPGQLHVPWTQQVL